MRARYGSLRRFGGSTKASGRRPIRSLSRPHSEWIMNKDPTAAGEGCAGRSSPCTRHRSLTPESEASSTAAAMGPGILFLPSFPLMRLTILSRSLAPPFGQNLHG